MGIHTINMPSTHRHVNSVISWIGGFQAILNRMTIDNFRWFLHVMLFIQTQRVIQKQKNKEKVEENEEDEEGIEVDEDDL